MPRFLGFCLIASTLSGFSFADKPATNTAGILELSLPESALPPRHARDRISYLSIDGKDHSIPRLTTRSITVRPKKGTDSVTVVYTFWPNVYTRFTRTKTIKVVAGETVKVSFDKPDKDKPDKIYVIYVPTPHTVVEAMCKLAKVDKEDVVYDIGCGDGRMVIHAVKKFGAKKGVGIDLSADLVKKCTASARKEGVGDKVTFLQKDALTIKDFSEPSVVLIYLGDDLNKALRPTLQKTMKPGTRIVSHRFLMGDWKPDKTLTIKAKDDDGDEYDFDIHLWVIKKAK